MGDVTVSGFKDELIAVEIAVVGGFDDCGREGNQSAFECCGDTGQDF
jgi:hypothetical protein